MKAEYVNSFYKATKDVLSMMLDVDTEKGELSVSEEMVSGKEANVLIGLTGDLSGNILYSFPKNMTLKMAKIMSGMEMEELDSFVTSALGELANIISGNAASNLSEQNYNCDIVPPQIIIGENRTISAAAEKALLVPLKTGIGEFQISISIQEKK